ncbi:MAG TPA: hypothetical protein GXX38_09385 [Clostridia bacterium]|nr:hypothetical protein [Clostridia bacterium]
MEAQVLNNFRKTGIAFIDDIPWGTHLCCFYETQDDLFDVVVPYLRAGLESNEYCMWIVSEPVSTFEAMNVLKKAIPDLKNYLPHLEILPHSEWYLKYGNFQGEKVMGEWINKVNHALVKGCEGLRITGCCTNLTNRPWKDFLDYEAMIEREIGKFNMIALCMYQLGKCGIHQILDIVNNHQFSFIKSKYDRKYTNNFFKFDRLNLLGKLAASIAHEIRNPMTSVKGFIQLLQNKDELKAYSDYFSLMIDELDRANGIITEYLSLAKEKENKENKVQKHNLNNILKALLPLLQADAIKEDKYVFLSLNDVEDILIDPKDIRQVVLNFCRNGLEAMEKGGVLEIQTYMEEDTVVLEIKDTGSGIPEEIISKLGMPFVTTKENGTGLGLFVSYRILENYKAKIDVKSSSAGTTFTICFPRPQSDF